MCVDYVWALGPCEPLEGQEMVMVCRLEPTHLHPTPHTAGMSRLGNWFTTFSFWILSETTLFATFIKGPILAWSDQLQQSEHHSIKVVMTQTPDRLELSGFLILFSVRILGEQKSFRNILNPSQPISQVQSVCFILCNRYRITISCWCVVNPRYVRTRIRALVSRIIGLLFYASCCPRPSHIS